jgi:hypothetical protein
MNNLQPVDMQGARIKVRSLSTPISKKVVMGLLAAMIALTMIVWLGFLGWGMVEILRSLAACIRSLWTAFF